MIARTAYEEAKREIEANAKIYTLQLKESLLAQRRLQKAISAARMITKEYVKSNVQTTFKGLREVGNDVVEHLAPELTGEEKALIVSNGIDYLTNTRYYNMTLPQRLKQSSIVLNTNLRRSGAVGKELETKLTNITRVLDEKYPFGAHKSWDIRLFLAEAVRLEHVISKDIADQKGWKFLRWTLSKSHSHVDMCDMYANNVDPEVKDFIEKSNWNISPKGVYFTKDVPTPPHPNCQCSVLPIKRKRILRPKKKPNLVQRILKAIFG